MEAFHQISGYAKVAVPVLAVVYALMLIYFDGPKDRSVYYKQSIAIIFYAIMAYLLLAAR